MERERPAINPELLEQLLKSIDKPEPLRGPDGLLDCIRSTRRVSSNRS
jgi:hypothetical protein